MLKKLFISRPVMLAGIILLSLSCATAPDLRDCGMIVTDEDNGKTITIARDKTLCIKLEARLSTGYGWTISRISGNLKESGKPQTESPSRGVTGGPEYQIFRLIAVKQGRCEIRLEYKRPWEKDEAPGKKFRITVQVTQ